MRDRESENKNERARNENVINRESENEFGSPPLLLLLLAKSPNLSPPSHLTFVGISSSMTTPTQCPAKTFVVLKARELFYDCFLKR